MEMFEDYDGKKRKWSSKDIAEGFLKSGKDTAIVKTDAIFSNMDEQRRSQEIGSMYSALRQYCTRHSLDITVTMEDGKVVLSRVRQTS